MVVVSSFMCCVYQPKLHPCHNVSPSCPSMMQGAVKDDLLWNPITGKLFYRHDIKNVACSESSLRSISNAILSREPDGSTRPATMEAQGGRSEGDTLDNLNFFSRMLWAACLRTEGLPQLLVQPNLLVVQYFVIL